MKMRRLTILAILLCAVPCRAQITSVVQVGVTPTQAAFTYTAPSASACTWQAAVDNGSHTNLTPLIRDLDSTLFTGANSDARLTFNSGLTTKTFTIGTVPLPGGNYDAAVENGATVTNTVNSSTWAANIATYNLSASTSLQYGDTVLISGSNVAAYNVPQFVLTASGSTITTQLPGSAIGNGTGATATRQNFLSRALQANTAYNYKITCGASTATGQFTTANGIGSTYAESPMWVTAGQISVSQLAGSNWGSGNYWYPTFHDVSGDAQVDPITGNLIARVNSRSSFGFQTGWWSANVNSPCGTVIDAGGYYCIAPFAANGLYNLYWVNAATNAFNFRGYMVNPATTNTTGGSSLFSTGSGWDDTIAGAYYAIGEGPFSGSFPLNEDILLIEYTTGQTNVSANSATPITTTIDLTPANTTGDIYSLMAAFTSGQAVQFTISQCPAFVIDEYEVPYLFLHCVGGQQDSPGWAVVFKVNSRTTGGASVVAAMPVFANPSCRWCGIHGGNPTRAANQAVAGGAASVLYIALHNNGSGGLLGPCEVTLTAAVTTGSQTNFTVSGEPQCQNPQAGQNPQLQTAQVGDYFYMTLGATEVVKLVTKISPTSWTVARNCDVVSTILPSSWTCSGTGGTYSIGTITWATCLAKNGGDVYWDFINDPHGLDGTQAYVKQETDSLNNSSSNHGVKRLPYFLMSGGVRIGQPMSVIGQSSNFLYSGATPFAGLAPFGYGVQDYESYGQSNASAGEQTWFVSNKFFDENAANDTISAVGGTTYLYKLVRGGSPAPTNAKILPTFTFSKPYRLMQERSAPSSVLNDTSGDNWVYCEAYAANECRSGSSPGDVFFNLPIVPDAGCTPSESAPVITAICYQSATPGSQGVFQLSTIQGTPILSSGPPPVVGGSRSRTLVSSVFNPYAPSYGAYDTPDGKGLLWASAIGDANINISTGADVYFATIPPYPTIGADIRQDYLQKTITVTVASCTSCYLKFGYDPVNFYCVQRQETCTARSSFSDGDPFRFITSDTKQTQDCTSSCSWVVPVIPLHTAYYQVTDGTHSSSVGIVMDAVTQAGPPVVPPPVLPEQAAITLNISVTQPAVVVTPLAWGPVPSSCNTATVNAAYSCALSTTGGTPPVSFKITNGSLPPGITLNASTGLLSGTPTLGSGANCTKTNPAICTYTATVTATDSTTARLPIHLNLVARVREPRRSRAGD
jgi:hypothetical protein